MHAFVHVRGGPRLGSQPSCQVHVLFLSANLITVDNLFLNIHVSRPVIHLTSYYQGGERTSKMDGYLLGRVTSADKAFPFCLVLGLGTTWVDSDSFNYSSSTVIPILPNSILPQHN